MSKQTSRKGKKAWRKNIDLEDLNAGLDSARENERQFGSKTLEQAGDALFTVDTAGTSGDVETYHSKKKERRLKSEEILARRSAVPGVIGKKTKKNKTLSKDQLDLLLKKAGRRDVDDKMTEAAIQADSVLETPVYDAWGETEVSVPKKTKTITASKVVKPRSEFQGFPQSISKVKNAGSRVAHMPKSAAPEGILRGTFGNGDHREATSRTRSTVRPSTLDHKPLIFGATDKAIEVPHEGRSYNPSMEAWQALLKEELVKEEAFEEERLQLEADQARVQHLMDTLEDHEDKDMEYSSGEEEEVASDEELEGGSVGLSINAPAKEKRKTMAKRRQMREFKDKERIRLQMKKEMKKIHDKMVQLAKRSEKSEQEKQDLQDLISGGEAAEKVRTRRYGKYDILEPTLDVKLSGELTDSLRRLKPEGSLMRDRFRSLQQRGRIEARKRHNLKPKYKKKVTEKWSFKDFK
ncbi:Ribosome biogenesis protein [Yarrowia sp. C11]|nr:Ribosome biogenesis protein [Yarrowia sp. E02]KAG5367281.1 Ribosome biogenesis protein [Yarrowia sp. C11]